MPIPDYWPSLEKRTGFGKEAGGDFVPIVQDVWSGGGDYAGLYPKIRPYIAAYKTKHSESPRISKLRIETAPNRYGKLMRYIIRSTKSKNVVIYIPPLLNWLWETDSDKAESFCKRHNLPKADELIAAGITLEFPSEMPAQSEALANQKLEAAPGATSQYLHAATKLQSDDIEEHIRELLADHEWHEIERDFERFVEEHESGFWCVTGGPGIGKTAIIASLAATHSGQANCIPYFFRQEWGNQAENSLLGFQRYALARMTTETGAPEGPQVDLDSAAESIKIAIHAASRSDAKQRPLIFFVDALDEMPVSDLRAMERGTPLLFPSRLPKGVFVAFSYRQEVAADPIVCFTAHHTHIALDASEQFERHKSIVQRYVRRVVRDNLNIGPYHGQNGRIPSDEKREQFISRLCTDANYNFMILRCVLHDDFYWQAGGSGIDLAGELPAYYEKHWQRMKDGDIGTVNAVAVLCFALYPNISRFSFLRMLCPADSKNDRMGVERALDQWIAQGLILQRRDENGIWLTIYHQTYRKFLGNEFQEQDRLECLPPIVENLFPDSDLQRQLREVENQSDQIRCEWITILLNLAKLSDNISVARTLLLDISFWQFACGTAGGLKAVMDNVSRINPIPRSRSRWQALVEALAIAMLEWIDERTIATPSGALTIDQLLVAAAGGHAGRRNDGSIDFARIFRPLAIRRRTDG